MSHIMETVRPDLDSHLFAFYLVGKSTCTGKPDTTWGPFFGLKLDGDSLLLDHSGTDNWRLFAHRCSSADCWHIDGDPAGPTYFSFTQKLSGQTG